MTVCTPHKARTNKPLAHVLVPLGRGALGAMAAIWVSATAVLSDLVPCSDDPRVSVEAGSDALVEKICTGVARARPTLNACHLKQGAPLVIRVVNEMPRAIAGCMAQYDCRDESISVIAPGRLGALLVDGNIWKRIPTDALFQSVIVHELAHAFLDQTECPKTPCYADHEYIAFALQIDSLSSAHREALMDGNTIETPVDLMGLNAFIAAAAPAHFAQKSWLHFNSPGNGCDFVKDIVEGRSALPVYPE